MSAGPSFCFLYLQLHYACSWILYLCMQTDTSKYVEVRDCCRNYCDGAVHQYLMFRQRTGTEKYKIDLHTPQVLRDAGRCLTAEQACAAASAWLKILRKYMGKRILFSSHEPASIMCFALLLLLCQYVLHIIYTEPQLLMTMSTEVLLTWCGMPCMVPTWSSTNILLLPCSVMDPWTRSDHCHWERPQHRSETVCGSRNNAGHSGERRGGRPILANFAKWSI